MGPRRGKVKKRALPQTRQDLLPQYPIKILKEKDTPSVTTEGHSCAPTAHLPRGRNPRQAGSRLRHERVSSDDRSAGARVSTCRRSVEFITKREENSSKRDRSNRACARDSKLKAANGSGVQLSSPRVDCPTEYCPQLLLNSKLRWEVGANMRAESQNLGREYVRAPKGKRVERVGRAVVFEILPGFKTHGLG